MERKRERETPKRISIYDTDGTSFKTLSNGTTLKLEVHCKNVGQLLLIGSPVFVSAKVPPLVLLQKGRDDSVCAATELVSCF